VHELIRQIAIVGEQEETGGIAVETAYGIDAFPDGTADELHDGVTLLRVGRGGEKAFGLIHQDIHRLLSAQHLAFIPHFIAWVYLVA